MIYAKYTNPFLMEDDEEEESPKEDKPEAQSPLLVKKMEKLLNISIIINNV